MPRLEQPVATAAEMEALGAKLASRLGNARVIYVHGPLGAGKTTFVRGMLRAFGHEGTVKSPTFTLVEPYDLKDISFYHFDLYRLNDPQELEFLGTRLPSRERVCVVEWAERAQGLCQLRTWIL
jgi:tRNA threonylcarbamoyladenosine biosynthesis protein TsaE